MSARETSNALAALLRWEAAGATWRLRSIGPGPAVVDLLTCDGSEVVDRVVSSDPDLVAYVREHQ